MSGHAPQFRALTRSALALIEGAGGDLAAAHDLHLSAVEVAVDSMDSPVIGYVLVGVADYALRAGEPARAAMLLGAADAVRGSVDRSVPDTDRIQAAARAELGEEGYERAYRSGDAVTPETVLAATGLLRRT
nr:hypothetical protein GCM10020092_087870 [Actinoplanes digitatis]